MAQPELLVWSLLFGVKDALLQHRRRAEHTCDLSIYTLLLYICYA